LPPAASTTRLDRRLPAFDVTHHVHPEGKLGRPLRISASPHVAHWPAAPCSAGDSGPAGVLWYVSAQLPIVAAAARPHHTQQVFPVDWESLREPEYRAPREQTEQRTAGTPPWRRRRGGGMARQSARARPTPRTPTRCRRPGTRTSSPVSVRPSALFYFWPSPSPWPAMPRPRCIGWQHSDADSACCPRPPPLLCMRCRRR
jgi:hypothetical protein